MNEREKKAFESILKGWFIGNIEDRQLLNFIMNYGLSRDADIIERRVRKTYGKG